MDESSPIMIKHLPTISSQLVDKEDSSFGSDGENISEDEAAEESS